MVPTEHQQHRVPKQHFPFADGDFFTIATCSTHSELFLLDVGWKKRCPLPGSLQSARTQQGWGREPAKSRGEPAVCCLRAPSVAWGGRKVQRRDAVCKFAALSWILCCRMQSCRNKLGPWCLREQNVLKKKKKEGGELLHHKYQFAANFQLPSIAEAFSVLHMMVPVASMVCCGKEFVGRPCF